MVDSILSEKYSPSSLSDLTYNTSTTNLLKSLSSQKDFPHLIFYGQDGSGKKTRLRTFLKEIYGNEVLNIRVDEKELKVNSKVIPYRIAYSNSHIELTPSDCGTNDKSIIQYIIKETMSFRNVEHKENKLKAKIIVINEADRLSKEAQSALRRTMEKFSSNGRIILICNYISKIISPIRSRCMSIRVSKPSQVDVERFLKYVIEKESIGFNDIYIRQLTASSDRNIRKALNFLQLSK